MAIALNADKWADAHIGWFFPGVIPSLDGQCVSLVKYFLQEMTNVPNPQAARGDARYVGKTLVAQGHAVEVPYSERKRGDIICYEYGEYGHISVQLSGGRVFEQNVNMPGTMRKLVDGMWVYSARIGSESESWRHDAHVYRIKSYAEGNTMYPTKPILEIVKNQTGFGKGANGALEPNFVAYWTTGTSNPAWGDPALVWANLMIEAYYAGRKEGQGMNPGKFVPTDVTQSGKTLFKEG